MLVYDTQSHEYYVMNDDDGSREMSKENVEDFFKKIKDGSLKAKGGGGVVSQVEKWIVESIRELVVSLRTFMHLSWNLIAVLSVALYVKSATCKLNN